MVAVLIGIADGSEPGRAADRINAARTVLEIARVAGIGAEEQRRPADTPLTEVEVSGLRAIVGALERLRAEPGQGQAVTVDGERLDLEGGSRETDVILDVDQEENATDSTDCDPRQAESGSDHPADDPLLTTATAAEGGDAGPAAGAQAPEGGHPAGGGG